MATNRTSSNGSSKKANQGNGSTGSSSENEGMLDDH
jgi:hypothetical protein